jgi:hypothetical protein
MNKAGSEAGVLSCHGTLQVKRSRSRGRRLWHDQFGLVAGHRHATGRDRSGRHRPRTATGNGYARRITCYARHHCSRRSRFWPPRRLSGVVCVSCLVDRCFCGADMSTPRFREWPVPVSLRLGGRFAGRLHSVEAELTGELVPEGAVLGSQAGDLGAGGIEPLAE